MSAFPFLEIRAWWRTKMLRFISFPAGLMMMSLNNLNRRKFVTGSSLWLNYFYECIFYSITEEVDSKFWRPNYLPVFLHVVTSRIQPSARMIEDPLTLEIQRRPCFSKPAELVLYIGQDKHLPAVHRNFCTVRDLLNSLVCWGPYQWG